MTSEIRHNNHSGCLICGRPIRYEEESSERTCVICGRTYESNAVCEGGHYVCDRCHSSGFAEIILFLLGSEENPTKLFLQTASLPGVHMHGPEHHSIVPCVMLTAYRNNGGTIRLEAALKEAYKRGRQVPGGFCGFWGACGAAVGAGVYASILTGASPLSGEEWAIPQRMTMRCLERMTEIGGPRCCKRVSRIAIEEAAAFTKEQFGIVMETEGGACTFHGENKECLGEKCPYYRK